VDRRVEEGFLFVSSTARLIRWVIRQRDALRSRDPGLQGEAEVQSRGEGEGLERRPGRSTRPEQRIDSTG